MDIKHLHSILESLDNVSKASVPTQLENKILEQFKNQSVEKTPIIALNKRFYFIAASLVGFTILNLGMFLIPESENKTTATEDSTNIEYSIATAYDLNRSTDYYYINSNKK